MDHNDAAPPHNGVRHLEIKAPNILLHSIGKLFSDANVLTFQRSASLSMVDSSLTPTPLINIRHLIVYNVVPGLELLLDGIMLPRLQFLRGLAVPLFVAFARRANQIKTLDTVDHLVITDRPSGDEICFSLKQWHIVLDVLPRLRTLLIQFQNPKCPPIGMAELFIDYIKRTIRSPLILFSCCIDHCSDRVSKEHFVNYLEERIEMECSSVQFASINSTCLDVWM
jgi:hypothetical protein